MNNIISRFSNADLLFVISALTIAMILVKFGDKDK